MWHTKMHFSAKCNSGRIAIHLFHIKHYLDSQYTKFQPYTFRVQKCVFCTIRDFGSPTKNYHSFYGGSKLFICDETIDLNRQELNLQDPRIPLLPPFPPAW